MKIAVAVLLLSVCMSMQNADAISDQRPIINFRKGIRDHILLAIGKCAGSLPKAYEYMTVIREGKYRDADDFRDFIHCGFRDSGYTFEDGSVNVEASAPLYPDPEAMKEALAPCHGIIRETPVETTFEYFKCFQQRSPYLIGP